MNDQQYDSINNHLRAIEERLDRLREVCHAQNENVGNLHKTLKIIIWMPLWVVIGIAAGDVISTLADKQGWW